MDVNAEIQRLKIAGYNVSDIYIYVKDYVSLDTFAHLYEAL